MYLNQKIRWQMVVRDDNHKPILDIYGQPTYVESTIYARKQPHVEEVVIDKGYKLISKSVLYTQDKVEVDDLLDNEVVVQQRDMITLGGNSCMRKVWTA